MKITEKDKEAKAERQNLRKGERKLKKRKMLTFETNHSALNFKAVLCQSIHVTYSSNRNNI
jgi:hypothetical protein